MNYKEVILLISALLGFLTIFLIGNRYNKNRPTNSYLIAVFFLCSFRFLVNGIPDLFNAISFKRQVDLVYFVSISPIIFLYFKKVTKQEKKILKKDLYHFVVPICLFLFINKYVNSTPEVIGLKLRTYTLITFNVIYAAKSFLFLKKTVWNDSEEILVTNQQNAFIKKWTYVLFGFCLVIFFIFFLNLIFNRTIFWYQFNNDFLWMTALLWIFLYLKVIYSPEFLYGYEMFQDKIKEYHKHKIIFTNIWISKNTLPVTNLQDKKLKEIIDNEIEKYILLIEELALNIDFNFSESFKTQELSNRLNIPKSHVTYLFKYHSKISFNDFKKIVRMHKVIQLIDDGYLKNNTFDALAIETGFSSYSAFFKTFKNSIGISPKEYYLNRKQKAH